MSKRLYVGNMSYDTEEAGLRTAFEAYGEVSDVNIITDRETGRKRGFGFVEFANDEDADKAVEAMDGQELDGRQLKVNVAREREERN